MDSKTKTSDGIQRAELCLDIFAIVAFYLSGKGE